MVGSTDHPAPLLRGPLGACAPSQGAFAPLNGRAAAHTASPELEVGRPGPTPVSRLTPATLALSFLISDLCLHVCNMVKVKIKMGGGGGTDNVESGAPASPRGRNSLWARAQGEIPDPFLTLRYMSAS